MRSLITIGGEVTAYIVIPLLREDAYFRNTTIIILKEIGAAAVPLLYSLLKDRDDDVRKFTVDLQSGVQATGSMSPKTDVSSRKLETGIYAVSADRSMPAATPLTLTPLANSIP